MTLLGLELSDAGIMVAGGEPVTLLPLDGEAQESPGFALPQKERLIVGNEAQNKAHLFPRQIINRFWDQLNTESLQLPDAYAPQNYAEIAYRHLAWIWEQVRGYGDEIVIAVPGFFDREQLGLLLGIAQELSMPVKGFVPMALAAAAVARPEKMLVHLDIHLHRIEVDYLDQGEHLSIGDSVTYSERGLIRLYQEWVDLIAREFVRTTRFDPYHQAASEQNLYDRLPRLLSDLQQHPSIAFEMTGGSRTYGVSLTRSLIAQRGETVYEEIRNLIERLRAKYGAGKSGVVFQLTHRLCRLPGCREMLMKIRDVELIELDQGAGARGVLKIWSQLADQSESGAISFFTRRPWEHSRREPDPVQARAVPFEARPTHMLYRGIGYPLSTQPLYIGREIDAREPGVRIKGQIGGVSRRHCSVQLRGREAVLENFSSDGTFVDETRVNASAVLQVGQKIRVGTPGEELQLIACLDNDETKKD